MSELGSIIQAGIDANPSLDERQRAALMRQISALFSPSNPEIAARLDELAGDFEELANRQAELALDLEETTARQRQLLLTLGGRA